MAWPQRVGQQIRAEGEGCVDKERWDEKDLPLWMLPLPPTGQQDAPSPIRIWKCPSSHSSLEAQMLVIIASF